MMENQKITIGYESNVPINLDDVLYLVEIADNGHKTFFRNCRVCGGTRSLTVNGVTFACPCCNHEEQAITVHKFIVRRYRVHKIEVEKGTDTWKPSNYKTVQFHIYKKTDRSHWCTTSRRLPYGDINPAEPLRCDTPVLRTMRLLLRRRRLLMPESAKNFLPTIRYTERITKCLILQGSKMIKNQIRRHYERVSWAEKGSLC